MFLGYFLKSNNFDLCTKNSGAGPDIKIQLKDSSICWIEAVAPGKGDEDNPNTVPAMKTFEIKSLTPNIETFDQKKPETYSKEERGKKTYLRKMPDEKIILRIRGAINDKWENDLKDPKDRKKKMIGDEDCYILAVNPFKIDQARYGDRTHIYYSCLYGIGDPCFDLDGNFLGFKERKRILKQRENKKPVPIPTDIFKNPSHKEISAIIFSCVSLHTCVNPKQNDFHLFCNKYAQNPLPLDIIEQFRKAMKVV